MAEKHKLPQHTLAVTHRYQAAFNEQSPVRGMLIVEIFRAGAYWRARARDGVFEEHRWLLVPGAFGAPGTARRKAQAWIEKNGGPVTFVYDRAIVG